MKAFIIAVCFCCGLAAASNLPFVVGGTVDVGTGVMNDDENGAGIVRITPFVGAWLQGLGYLRVGYGLYDFESNPDGGEKVSVEHRDFSVMLGVTVFSGPYIQGSYTRAKNLSKIGDVSWNEFGVGLGTNFILSASAALVTEIEYRWVLSHYDPILEETVSGSRLQLHFGFVVYVY